MLRRSSPEAHLAQQARQPSPLTRDEYCTRLTRMGRVSWYVPHDAMRRLLMAGGCLLGQRAGRAAAARRGGAVSADTVDWAEINTVECRCRQTVACSAHAQRRASTFF